MLSREFIEFCIDEGVCCLCGKSIRWGHDAVYTINGAHYECQFPDGRPASPIGNLSPLIFGKQGIGSSGFGDSPHPVLARANGGHVLHWVVPQTGVALCGHKPKNNNWKMKARGRWFLVPASADLTKRRLCHSCDGKHDKAFPKSQNAGSGCTDTQLLPAQKEQMVAG
ncbi:MULTISPECIES: hypothetical protein [Pseudomonas]|uniref:hypothetical protein n=1 Tax=Pseudomonas TaxID=286 RepID=UPI0012E337F3|nr:MULTISPECIES: hypothetical protein [Pseudomonas]WHS57365.1 hypothetical protein QLH64_30575 [Pseudomonas brassicacearum]